MFIPFFIFWSLWHGSEKVSCHFPAKCRFLCRKINKQDSWFFRFWFFWQESRGWGMEWTGQKTRNILIHILITVYKDSNNLQRSQTLQSLKPSLNWPITLLQMANRAGWVMQRTFSGKSILQIQYYYNYTHLLCNCFQLPQKKKRSFLDE